MLSSEDQYYKLAHGITVIENSQCNVKYQKLDRFMIMYDIN